MFEFNFLSKNLCFFQFEARNHDPSEVSGIGIPRDFMIGTLFEKPYREVGLLRFSKYM